MLSKTHAEERHDRPTFDYEVQARNAGYSHVAGIDEVGRGALAGPVVAASVILPQQLPEAVSTRINDSKKLTPTQRVEAFEAVSEFAISIGIGICSPQNVDASGIVHATESAMVDAVKSSDVAPDFLLIDGASNIAGDTPSSSVIKGDTISLSIAAASIVAKVTRDRIMSRKYGPRYPEYGFAAHKGYGTKKHLVALRTYGPSPIHRRSFKPVSQVVSDRAWNALGKDSSSHHGKVGNLRLKDGIGKRGEDVAARHMNAVGYNILRRNYRTRQGEVDIIADDGGVLVFAEVKTRNSTAMGTPAEGFTKRKFRRIISAAMTYIAAEFGTDSIDWRVDFVGVEISKIGKVRNIDLVQNATAY